MLDRDQVKMVADSICSSNAIKQPVSVSALHHISRGGGVGKSRSLVTLNSLIVLQNVRLEQTS